MKKIYNGAAILTVLLLTTAACKKDIDNGGTTTAGGVSGKVTDAQGNAIGGVKVVIEHTVWYDSYVYATTAANGAYNATLPAEPAGDWTAKARIERTAYGQTYKFDLQPSSTEPFNRNSAVVRNFNWKLSGKMPGGDSYYGAHIDLYAFGTGTQMDKIKLLLTPVESTLIDGSPATAIERTVEDVAGTFMARDIPIGKYTVKALYEGKTLLLENRHDEGGAAPVKQVVFGKNGLIGETEYNIEFWVSE